MRTIGLMVGGMRCRHCVREVTARLRDVAGIDTVTADADRSIEDGGRGPKELTGMVDLTRGQHGQVHARLLDLVPGRSGQAYRTWLVERGEAFRPASRSPPSTRSTATRTPSTTSSRTPSPCSTRFMS